MYRQPSEEFAQKDKTFHVKQAIDKIIKNKNMINNPGLMRLEQRQLATDTTQKDRESTMNSVGKASVLNQVLRQCNFRKNPVSKRNFQQAMSKQKAIRALQNDIRGYNNLSTVTQEADLNKVNQNGEIPFSYTQNKRHLNTTTLDPTRVSQETANAFES